MQNETIRLATDQETARKRAEISRQLQQVSERMERDRARGKEPPIPVFRRDGDRFTVIIEES
jgi:hypothetical protein